MWCHIEKYQVRVCPYMSSSTFRAISNTGFLFLFSTCFEMILEGRYKQSADGFKQKKSCDVDKVNLPPHKLPQKSVKHREEKVHQEQAVQLLPHKALPTLKATETKNRQVHLGLFHIPNKGQSTANMQLLCSKS